MKSVDLENCIAVVSGVGPGLGRDIALVLASAGADVVLAARSEDRLHAVQSDVERLGRRALPIVTDITSRESCENLAETAIEHFGRIDILVNNAFFIGDMQPFEDTNIDESWAQALDVNLLGHMRLSQAVVPKMKEQGGGSIVMINSVSMCDYRKHKPAVISYASSKAGLQSAVLYMAGELGKYGIRVNSVRPGYIDGEALQNYFFIKADELGVNEEDIRKHIIDEELALTFIPHSSDIADTVLFFASDLSRAVTGAMLDVNAGERLAMQ